MIYRSLFERILRFFFYKHYCKKDRYEKHIKDFPCDECRPDLSYTFYDNFHLTCSSCGRDYSI